MELNCVTSLPLAEVENGISRSVLLTPVRSDAEMNRWGQLSRRWQNKVKKEACVLRVLGTEPLTSRPL